MLAIAMAKIIASEKSMTGAEVHGGADHHEDAEDQLEHHLLALALAEHVGPGLEAVIGPGEHGREGEQEGGECQDVAEARDVGGEGAWR